MDWVCNLFKKEVEILEKWQGHYTKDNVEIELTFEDFTFNLEGGLITGHTTDGKTASGKVNDNHELIFKLEADNCITLYFEGRIPKTNPKKIFGNYGFEEGEFTQDSFQIYLK